MNTLELFFLFSGFLFWACIIGCGLLLVFGLKNAQESPDEHIYRKSVYEKDAVDSEIDTKFLKDLDEINF